MDSLQGMFLIATNQMVDPRFKESVILICNHDESGALGLILTNIYSEISFEDILASVGIEKTNFEYPTVYCGGPVSLDALFVLHPAGFAEDYLNSIKIMSDVFLGNDLEILSCLADSVFIKNVRFFLGYSGWGPGQLEQELGFDGWLVLPASSEDVFACPPDALWKQVTLKHGIDIDLFNDISGNA